MGGASAAISSSTRVRKKSAKGKASTAGGMQSRGGSDNEYESSGRDLFVMSASALHEKEGNLEKSHNSLNSWAGPPTSRPPKDDERENNNSSLDSRGMALHHRGQSAQDNNTQKDSFNENGSVTSISSKLPSWFHTLNDGRKWIGARVNDERVQNFILLLIVINSIMMGVATFDFVKTNEDLSYKFDLVDQIFLVIFTVESALQLFYFGWKLFKDGFLVFDLLIVIMSWALEGTQVIRAFRIFRALRLVTRVQVMRNLIMALFSVIPKMTAIGLLLLLIMFIFGVMFTTLFKGMYPAEELTQPYFESLFYSLFTLFQMMTLVSTVTISGVQFFERFWCYFSTHMNISTCIHCQDEWADILGQVQVVYPWAWAPFIIFIILTGFIVVNLVIAVICDAVHVLGGETKAGLYGFEEEELKKKNDRPFYQNVQAIPPAPSTYSSSSAAQRLEELQKQLDEMVMVQDQMRRTIEILSSRLTFFHDVLDRDASEEGEGDR